MKRKVLLLPLLIIISSLPVMAQSFIEILSNPLNYFDYICGGGGGSFLKYIIGTECAGTMAFLMYLIMWFVVIMILFDIIATYSPFSGWTSFAIAFGISVIMANFGFVSTTLEWFSELITTWSAIKVIALIIAISLIYIIIKSLMQGEKKKRREQKVKEEEEKILKVGKGLGEVIEK